MNVTWRLPLYSYKEKYDCAFHTLEVVSENQNLKIAHVENIQRAHETVEGKAVNCFLGVYGVTTFLLSKESGEVFEHHRLETETLPDDLNPAHTTGQDISRNRHYLFDEYDIFMESNWTMCCQERNRQRILWKKNIRHYLYTEVECKDGILYFGTQGNGGLFYALSITEGTTLFALQNSGFHPEYHWVDGALLIADPKGTWNLVNPKTGAIMTSAFNGDIKYRSGNDFVVLCEKYNRSARLYDAELVCVRL